MPLKKTTTSASSKTTTTKAKTTKTSSMTTNPYKSNGITVSPATFSYGDKIKVTYNGLLSQAGADEIYAHIGWGDNWDNVNDVKMSKTKTGFTATITADYSSLNLCFKDTCNNWDNNNGNNYVYCND